MDDSLEVTISLLFVGGFCLKLTLPTLWVGGGGSGGGEICSVTTGYNTRDIKLYYKERNRPACMIIASSKETRQVTVALSRKCCLCSDICKWLDFLVFSDKDDKP